MGKLSRAAGGISRLVFGDNADGGSGAQGVEQLIQFVRNRRHLGLGGRTGNGPDQVFSQLSTNRVNWPRVSTEDIGE